VVTLLLWMIVPLAMTVYFSTVRYNLMEPGPKTFIGLHNYESHAQAVLFGLSASHDAASIGYAVIEGVGFGLRDGLASMGVAAGEAEALSLVGGGARSPWWAGLLASTLGLPLQTHAGGEAGGAIGAARLAWLSTGADLDRVCTPPPVVQRFDPDPAEAQRLADRYARFRALYPALRERFGPG
jgi:xylulokinase